MSKPLLVMDQHFRKLEELFRPGTYAALSDLCRIEGGQNWPMDRARIASLLPRAEFVVAAEPSLTRADIDAAENLRAVIEVSGAFHGGLDYQACFDRGIEALSCSPGFRESVAEMCLAMVLAGCRGLVHQHEAFRIGAERWVEDRIGSDVSLFGQRVGFIGFGQIAQETHRLMVPFRPRVMAYDPWLSTAPGGVQMAELNDIVSSSRIVIVAATPTAESQALLGAEQIGLLQDGALVVVISRAYCVDFEALLAEAQTGRITLATDVFPLEPVHPQDPVRTAQNVILSPHRAAAVEGGRWLIGDMILHDVQAILEGRPERQLKRADPRTVASIVEGQKRMADAGLKLPQ